MEKSKEVLDRNVALFMLDAAWWSYAHNLCTVFLVSPAQVFIVIQIDFYFSTTIYLDFLINPPYEAAQHYSGLIRTGQQQARYTSLNYTTITPRN